MITRRRQAERFGVPRAESDHRRLLDDPSIDAVDIVAELPKTSTGKVSPASTLPVVLLMLEAVRDLSSRIYADFAFDPGFTTLATPLEEVLDHEGGVIARATGSAMPGQRGARWSGRWT